MTVRQGTLVLVLWLCGAAACERAPIELGFWMAPLSFQSPRLGDPVSEAEFVVIENVARAEVANAFSEFHLRVTANRHARFNVGVVPSLKDWRRLRGTGNHAGESRAVSGFGGSGSVNFEFVANGAMVFAPEHAGRAEVIHALGRGLGRVAIHEFLHQLLPKRPTHDARDPQSYEGNSPARVEGYFGELHWDVARPWLNERLKLR